MKKTRFFLMALLLVTVLVFTSCGSNDADNNAIPDNQENGVEQDIKNGADDVKDGVEDIGDDIDNGARDAADDIKDGVDNNKADNNKAGNDGDVSKNTVDNGTKSTLQ